MACVLLFALTVCVPTGSATLTEEVTGTANSVVGGVASTEATPPPPPAPVEPAPSPAEAAPSQVAASPAGAASLAPGPAVESPSAEPVEDVATSAHPRGVGPTGGGTGTSAESAESIPASSASGQTEDPGPRARRDFRRASAPGREADVKASGFAPLNWLLAYVWPAIALRAELVSTMPAAATGLPARPGLAAGIARWRPAPGGLGRLSPAIPLPQLHASRKSGPTPPWEPVLSLGAKLLFYAVIAALLAVLAFMIWAEFNPAPRRPGHRG